ncbi:transcription factor HES-4-like [Penaeus monodon]|uniref:transcription factor HES-4-like n=1 Tax=Penaeus monodon TaxID=6687 RepID=UPI0018A76100|nr:transcription factor HES-4-like [Penaeus monodon]
MVSSVQMEPVSRTDQYKRVMKPLLERKRRARINRCLDELRDLLVAALQAEGETVTRLEKADILELTVRHVRRLNQRRRLTLPPGGHDPRHDALKFQQGFVAAAQQVQSFLIASPSLEPAVSSRLLTHLTSCASAMTGVPPSSGPVSPPVTAAPLATPPTASPPAPAVAPVPRPAPAAHPSVVMAPCSVPAHVPAPAHGPQHEARPQPCLDAQDRRSHAHPGGVCGSARPVDAASFAPGRPEGLGGQELVEAVVSAPGTPEGSVQRLAEALAAAPSSRRLVEARRSGSSACDEGGGAGVPLQHLCVDSSCQIISAPATCVRVATHDCTCGSRAPRMSAPPPLPQRTRSQPHRSPTHAPLPSPTPSLQCLYCDIVL